MLLRKDIGNGRLFARGQSTGCLAQIDAHDLRAVVEPRVLVPQIFQHLQVKAAEIVHAAVRFAREGHGHHLRKLRGVGLLYAAGVPHLGAHAAFDLGSEHAAAVQVQRHAVERQGVDLRLSR